MTNHSTNVLVGGGVLYGDVAITPELIADAYIDSSMPGYSWQQALPSPLARDVADSSSATYSLLGTF